MDDTRRVPDQSPKLSPEARRMLDEDAQAWEENPEIPDFYSLFMDGPEPEPNPLANVPPPGLSERAKQWNIDNAEAIEARNRWIDEHGMPFDDLRRG